MKKILVVLGTRPEALKLATVIHELKRYPAEFKVAVCSTGQHGEMLYQVIDYFHLTLEYDLKIMRPGQTLSALTAALFSKLPSVIDEYKPDVILVQGDTTTAFAGALAGYYFKVKVGHIEAGLRTSNKYAPFPEEMNRRLVGGVADYHFAPTLGAQKALLQEGVSPKKVTVTGNTIIDALFYTIEKIKRISPPLGELEPLLEGEKKVVLITGHRRENFGEGFRQICQAIHELAEKFNDVNFVYPVHLNPNVQKPVYDFLSRCLNVKLIPPVDYPTFVKLLNGASIILTDSGGVQEEGPSLGKPVIVMRDVTERPEAVEAGTAILVGTDKDKIISEVSRLLTDDNAYNAMSKLSNPFGDGKASMRIVEFLKKV